jgi:hypothetical protein
MHHYLPEKYGIGYEMSYIMNLVCGSRIILGIVRRAYGTGW